MMRINNYSPQINSVQSDRTGLPYDQSSWNEKQSRAVKMHANEASERLFSVILGIYSSKEGGREA